ncbi:hypothetical protein [Mesorhizobium cantuariense]|uniref:Uncharacterized protein n=1 Tax=Mesorhizobium cantuariense TaxID=1300275 RepID=A0ABV7MHN6_9HYPH
MEIQATAAPVDCSREYVVSGNVKRKSSLREKEAKSRLAIVGYEILVVVEAAVCPFSCDVLRRIRRGR